MPANLTPQYLKAEQAYRQAATPEEELRCLEEMLRTLPKHKGTDKLQAELKQKISRARKEVQQARSSGKRRTGLRIPRQGAGRVVLLGGPNAGKSRFVETVTRARPQVAAYPFTTQEPAPAMMPFEDIQIQLIDTPPVSKDYLDPRLLGIVRGADLALLLVDLGTDEGPQQALDVVARFEQTKTRLAERSYLDENDVGLSFTRTLLVPNKIDLPESADRLEFLQACADWAFPVYPISCETGDGLDALRRAIFEALDVVRVYTKEPNAREPDMERPYTLRRGGTLADVAELIHKELAARLKGARVWGSHVHDGTMVKGDYVVHDKDIVEIHTR